MDARLFRLMIFLSLLSLLIFGYFAVSKYMSASTLTSIVNDRFQSRDEQMVKCRSDRSFCDILPIEEDKFLIDTIKLRNNTSSESYNFLGAALGVPISLFVLFFGGRYVITGRLKNGVKNAD
jgi:hypothetical protein